MQWRSYLGGIAALLIGSGSVCLGMGSGPHPTVPFGIPPEVIAPTSAERESQAEVADGLLICVLGSVAYAWVLVWRGRAKRGL